MKRILLSRAAEGDLEAIDDNGPGLQTPSGLTDDDLPLYAFKS